MTAGPPDGVVGRGAEIDVLQSFIERAGLGGEALVLVGDAGVGKTALLDVAARHAGSLGVSVVRAAGAEFEADISFSALHQSLLPLLNGIEELRPLYRDALSVALGLGEGRPPDRLVVSGAALELVRRAGQRAAAADRAGRRVLDGSRQARRCWGSWLGGWPAATSACWPHCATRPGASSRHPACLSTSSSRWTGTRRTASCERGSRSSVRTCAGVCSPKRPAIRSHCSSCRRR